MIENFTLDTDANPENMNMLIAGINKNEEDISALKTSVEDVGSAIGQIANDRGYLNSKSLGSDINLDTFFIPGRYYSSTCLGRPNSDAFIIDVSGVTSASSAITQKATCYYGAGNVNFGKTYERTYYQASGGWTAWKEIATETNTQIIKNVPAGVTKIKDLPMGIYHIYGGNTKFTDYPSMAKNMGHNYGILMINFDAIAYKTYSLIASDSSASHNAEYTGFGGVSGEIKWSGVIPYSVVAAGGVTILTQNSFIKNGVVYINMAVKKTDNGNFVAGAQYSICSCPNLILTYPKHMVATPWDSNASVLIGYGGTGVLFVDSTIYMYTPIACPVMRITGSFLLEG